MGGGYIKTVDGEVAVHGFDGDIRKLCLQSKEMTKQNVLDLLYVSLSEEELASKECFGYWDFSESKLLDQSHWKNDTGELVQGRVEQMNVELVSQDYSLLCTDAHHSVTVESHDAYQFGTGALTIETWFKTYSGGILLRHADGTTESDFKGWEVIVNELGMVCVHLGDLKDPFHVQPPYSVLDNDWHHLNVTRDSEGMIDIELNGTSIYQQKHSVMDVNAPEGTKLVFGASLGNVTQGQEEKHIPGSVLSFDLALDGIRTLEIYRVIRWNRIDRFIKHWILMPMNTWSAIGHSIQVMSLTSLKAIIPKPFRTNRKFNKKLLPLLD